jgi:hypothetical protein
MLCFQHQHVMALAAQLKGSHQAGNAGADDDDALALAGLVEQTLLGHEQQTRRWAWCVFGRWLAAFDGRGLVVQGNPLFWPPESTV